MHAAPHQPSACTYSVIVWWCEPAECVSEGDEWRGEAGALGPGGAIAKVVQLFRISRRNKRCSSFGENWFWKERLVHELHQTQNYCHKLIPIAGCITNPTDPAAIGTCDNPQGYRRTTCKFWNQISLHVLYQSLVFLLHELRYLTCACARRSPCPPLYVFWFNQNSTSICVSKPEYVLVTVRISRIQLSVSYAPKLPEPGRGRWKVGRREGA